MMPCQTHFEKERKDFFFYLFSDFKADILWPPLGDDPNSLPTLFFKKQKRTEKHTRPKTQLAYVIVMLYIDNVMLKLVDSYISVCVCTLKKKK